MKVILPKYITGKLSVSRWISDGDTFAFKANDIADWIGLDPRPKPTLANPWVRLRLDGLDAPELHASGQVQSQTWGRAATQETWSRLGGNTISWSISGNIPLSGDELDCTIRVIGIDKFYRVISALWAPGTDKLFPLSENVHLVSQGLAYPSPYETTPLELIDEIRSAWADAIANVRGFTDRDETQSFNIFTVAAPQDAVLIHPKVWRRVNLFAVTYSSTENWEVYMKKRNDLYLPTVGKVQNLRRSLIRTGDEINIDIDPVTAMWFTTGGFTSSQILAFISTIAR